MGKDYYTTTETFLTTRKPTLYCTCSHLQHRKCSHRTEIVFFVFGGNIRLGYPKIKKLFLNSFMSTANSSILSTQFILYKFTLNKFFGLTYQGARNSLFCSFNQPIFWSKTKQVLMFYKKTVQMIVF